MLEAEREAELRREHDGHFLINRRTTLRLHACVTRSEVAHRFAQLEVFKDLCSDLIGPGAILYWDQLVYKKPETDENSHAIKTMDIRLYLQRLNSPAGCR